MLNSTKLAYIFSLLPCILVISKNNKVVTMGQLNWWNHYLK